MPGIDRGIWEKILYFIKDASGGCRSISHQPNNLTSVNNA